MWEKNNAKKLRPIRQSQDEKVQKAQKPYFVRPSLFQSTPRNPKKRRIYDKNTRLRIKILKMGLNPHLHERVLEHRDQKYVGEVSFRPAEYRNRPPIVSLICNFKNFGEF